MNASPFRNVLVPFDGSGLSEMAMPFAIEFARRSGGRVTLVRALPEPALVTDIPRSVLGQVTSAARKELAAAAARAGEGIVVKTMLREGMPPEVILRESKDADLIAMTTHGRSGVSRLVLGSITEKVIRLSPIPVLVVRPRRGSLKSAATTAGRMFSEICVPLDGSELAVEAISPYASALAEDSRLHLVTVVRNNANEKEEGASADWLAARASNLEARGVTAITRVVHNDSPAEGIGSYAENNDCGLIVMSTHGAGGLREWMLGSVTDQVIRRGPVPVLVVPSPGRAKKTGRK